MATTGLEGGFANAPVQSAQTFRAVLNAMAHPGRIETVSAAQPPLPMDPAAGAVLLTLADHETKVFLAPSIDSDAIRSWLTFHTGAPLLASGAADFAIGHWDELLPIDQYQIGTAAYPDRSVTLVVTQPALTDKGTVICGPGIQSTASLNIPDTALLDFNANRSPLGIDMIMTAGDQLAAVPRSTRVFDREKR